MHSFFNYTIDQFAIICKELAGKREYYSHAIYKAIYREGVSEFSRIPVLSESLPLQEALVANVDMALMPVTKVVEDGDVTKFITTTHDSLEIESVILPMSHYWTLCVSSQIGCKMGCDFCETAQMGLVRHLQPYEIVQQVYTAKFVMGYDIRNIVFMGMGEPFDNFDNVIQAINILCEPKGLSFAKSQITVSTVGRIDGIQKLAALGWKRLNLAVSLNAPNDELRSKLMPINIKVPLAELQKALINYPLRKSGIILVEYVLIKDVNDQEEHLDQLAEFIRPFRARLNLIPYNPRNCSPFAAPTEEGVSRFYQGLYERNVFVCRRKTQGQDQMAACGQLGNRELRRVKKKGP